MLDPPPEADLTRQVLKAVSDGMSYTELSDLPLKLHDRLGELHCRGLIDLDRDRPRLSFDGEQELQKLREAEKSSAIAPPPGDDPPQPGGTATPAAGDTETLPSEGKRHGMSVEDVAERLNRLRLQGEPWTSQEKVAKRIGCSSSTVNKAIDTTTIAELKAWAKPEAAPRAVGQGQSPGPGAGELAPVSREPDPANAAAEDELRDLAENADAEQAFRDEMRSRANDFLLLYMKQNPGVRRACRQRWED
jgi:hypothetical protein